MITPPAGWSIERTDDGLLIAPERDREHAILRYRERLRPLRPAMQLVAAAPLPDGFVVRATSTPKRLVTLEGEHAAFVTRTGTLGGRDVVLVYGYVFLDDSYAALEGIVPPPLVATVEQLVAGDTHLLGRVRRRRIMYAAPPGWRVEGDAFEARWFAPDESARILVNPALPRTPGLVTAILDKLGITGDPAERFTTHHGLAGERYDAGDTQLYFLGDADFVYSVRADRAPAEARVLVESIEPVPRGGERPSSDALTFWAD